MTKWKPKERDIPVDDLGASILWSTLANLIGGVSLIVHLGGDLRKFKLPPQLLFEREVINALYVFDDDHAAPTRENIIGYLTESRGVVDAEAQVDRILQFRTLQERSNIKNTIQGSYTRFKHWLRKTMRLAALREAIALIEQPNGLLDSEVDAEVVKLLNKSLVSVSRQESMSLEELAVWYGEVQRVRGERAAKTGSPFPLMMFEELNQKVAAMRPGNPLLVSMKSGYGKTLLATKMAEHWAWEYGYRVEIIAKETGYEDYEEREMARHFGIPQKLFTDSVDIQLDAHQTAHIPVIVDMNNHPFWYDKIGTEMMLRYVEEMNTGRGRVDIHRLMGTSAADDCAFITQLYEDNFADGYETIFIIDYLQKYAWGTGESDEERIQITNAAAQIKTTIDTLQTYCVVMAQAGDEAGSLFGSSVPAKLFQTHLGVIRSFATEVEPVTVGGKPVYNAIGEQRLFALTGGLSGTKAEIKIFKANSGEVGAKIPIIFENALYNVYCPLKLKRKDPRWGLRDYPYFDMRYFLK